jgi:hypothetical protein
VLIFEAEPWDSVRAKIRGGDLWKPVGQNKSDRYHFLQAVPSELDLAGEGLPALVVDFKRFFTLPATEIERQIANGEARRRCRLLSPYREHLQSRIAFYLQRVGLPEPHDYPTKVQPLALPRPKPRALPRAGGETATQFRSILQWKYVLGPTRVCRSGDRPTRVPRGSLQLPRRSPLSTPLAVEAVADCCASNRGDQARCPRLKLVVVVGSRDHQGSHPDH